MSTETVIKTNKGETLRLAKGEKADLRYCGKKYARALWSADDGSAWTFFNGLWKEVKLNNAKQRVIGERSDFRWAKAL